ncbi:MAG: ABC transporter permease [Promethearchaeota archaeon]
MSLFRRALSVTVKDLKGWVRKPFLIGIAVIPLIIVLIFTGIFVHRAESMPAGVILEDSDPKALEFKTLLMTMRSGTGLRWFTIEDLPATEVLEQFEAGRILCYIVIPANLTVRLEANETVSLHVMIHNIQDDVTKNVLQRVEYACNEFNRALEVGSLTYYSPGIQFETLVPIDVGFSDYVVAGILALVTMLSSSVNVATTTAQEFEEGTVKELIMGASLGATVIGKLLAGITQSLVCLGIVSMVAFALYRFVPLGNLLLLFGVALWSMCVFSSLGFLAAARVKKVIPAGMLVMILNLAGWWIGGGLVPAEVWTQTQTTRIISLFAVFWPGTYIFRSFTNLALLNITATLPFDLLVTGVFGIVTFVLAIWLFGREAKTR